MGQLVISGSPTFNGDSTCTINSTGSDLVRAPSVLLNPVQLWVAVRVRLSFASTDVTNRRFFNWGADTNNELFIEWTTASLIGCGRDSGGGLTQSNATPAAFAAASSHTIIGRWLATTVGISFDGSAFATQLNSGNPPVPALFDIGVRGYTPANWTESDFHWVAAGTGSLSDADAVTLDAFGDTDPAFTALPATPVFLWTADDANYIEPAYAIEAARDFAPATFGPF